MRATSQVFTAKGDDKGESPSNGKKFSQAADLLKARRSAWLTVTFASNTIWPLTHPLSTRPPQRYGSAYLITSISLAIISYALCYSLIDAGVDVAAVLRQVRASEGRELLSCVRLSAAAVLGFAHAAHTNQRRPPQFGIQVSGTSEQVGTAALAYAVHKAASPIRFPPTVALTPVRFGHCFVRTILSGHSSKLLSILRRCLRGGWERCRTTKISSKIMADNNFRRGFIFE